MSTDHPDTLVDLHAHRDWANRQVVAWWLALPTPEAAPLRLLSHILRAEAVWLDRLEGSSPKGDIWEPLSVSELEQWPKRHRQRLDALLVGAKALDRSRKISYRRLNGESMENNVADILTHMATHGVHHRAQISSWAAANGHKPPMLDYILFARR